MGYNFDTDLRKSDEIHRSTFAYLYTALGYTFQKVEDKLLQSFGVDTIAFTQDGEIYFIEEKTDYYPVKNICVEVGNLYTGNTGWVNKPCLIGKSFIYYYFVKDETLFVFDFAKFKNWFATHQEAHREITTQSGVQCRLVPIDAIPEDCIVDIKRVKPSRDRSTN